MDDKRREKYKLRADKSKSVRCQSVAVSAAGFSTCAAIQDLIVFYDSYDAQIHS